MHTVKRLGVGAVTKVRGLLLDFDDADVGGAGAGYRLGLDLKVLRVVQRVDDLCVHARVGVSGRHYTANHDGRRVSEQLLVERLTKWNSSREIYSVTHTHYPHTHTQGNNDTRWKIQTERFLAYDALLRSFLAIFMRKVTSGHEFESETGHSVDPRSFLLS